MSIKQNGGVFGRNPTFNDVTIEGQLTFDGDIDINSDLKVDGELEVTGEILANGGIGLGDNDLVTFGVGDDLTLRHNGSNSYITNTTGILVIQGTNSGTWVLNGSGQPVFKTDANAVILGYGSSEKFRTVNAGISVTGNVVVPSGNGIDFSATSGTGTSELLDDYEEGTWTPVVTSSAGAIAAYSATGTYTKIGRAVSVNYNILISSNGTGSGFVKVDSLPFTQSAFRSVGVGLETDVVGFPFTSNGIGSTTFCYLNKIDGSYPAGTSYRLQGNFVYNV